MKTILTAIVGGASFLLGGWHIMLVILTVMMVLDIITGLIKGTMLKELKSRKMTNGLFRKAGFLILIVMASMLDLFVGAPVFRNMVVGFLIINEAVSITENLTLMGVPIPQQITKFLDVNKDGENPKEAIKAQVEKIEESVEATKEVLNSIPADTKEEDKKQ